MKAVDQLAEIIKSAKVGFPPSVKDLEGLLAQMVLEGLESELAWPVLADADE